MKQLLLTVAIVATIAGSRAFAHHSYSAYEMDRVVEIQGILDEFAIAAPHSLVKLKGDDGRRYTAEWLAPLGLKRRNIEDGILKPGDRIVLTGNPHRDFSGNGVLNFQSLTRPADGLRWEAPRRAR